MAIIISFLGGIYIPMIGKYSGIGNAFMAGATGCLISLITSIILIRLDERARIHDTKMIEEQ